MPYVMPYVSSFPSRPPCPPITFNSRSNYDLQNCGCSNCLNELYRRFPAYWNTLFPGSGVDFSGIEVTSGTIILGGGGTLTIPPSSTQMAPTQQEIDMSNMEALKRVRGELDTEWADIKLACDKARRVLLWGPPGTGKSYIGTDVPKERLSRLYITMDTPAAEVRGHYLPNEKGGFSWHDGPGIASWRKGGRLVIDEIDAASGDTLTLLMGLLDDPESAKLTLPTNETIYPAEGFSCIATTNQAPTVMPEPLLDRFDVVIHVTRPAPWAFQSGWYSRQLAEAAERAILLTSDGNSIKGKGNRPIGLRAFKAIDRLHGGQAKLALNDAARLVIGKEAAHWFMTAMKLA